MRIAHARSFLAEQRSRRKTEPTIDTTVLDGNRRREAILRDLLSAEDWSYVESLAGTVTTDENTLDADDPLAAAQAASDARYGKGPTVPTTERAKAFVNGTPIDDHWEMLKLKYKDAK